MDDFPDRDEWTDRPIAPRGKKPVEVIDPEWEAAADRWLAELKEPQ